MKDFKYKGKFISIEGCEACGKSSQIALLKEYFSNRKDVVFTREPGGSIVAEQIREILVKGDPDKLDPKTEALLHFAARRSHLEKFIIPNLEKGNIVISDRFVDSSYAYQGYAQGLDLTFLEELDGLAINNFRPHLTLLLDLDYEISKKRIKERGNEDERYEKFDADFHKRVREGFLDLAEKNKGRFVIINADQAKEEIHKQIIEKISCL